MKMRPTLAGQETNSPGTEAKLAPVKAVNSNFMEFDESFTDSDNYQETRARSGGRTSPIYCPWISRVRRKQSWSRFGQNIQEM